MGEGTRKEKKYHFVSLRLPGGTGAGGVDGRGPAETLLGAVAGGGLSGAIGLGMLAACSGGEMVLQMFSTAILGGPQHPARR